MAWNLSFISEEDFKNHVRANAGWRYCPYIICGNEK